MRERVGIQMLGVDFRTAPVAVREALGFQDEEALLLLRRVAQMLPDLEVAVLSTCNRTEFYFGWIGGDERRRIAQERVFLNLVQDQRPSAQPPCGDRRRRERGPAAMRHLTRVACGLESAILGDVHVLAQVKDAFSLARKAGTIGSVLEHTFAEAIRAGRRSRNETCIGLGSASLGSALATLLQQRWQARANKALPRILVVGTGSIGRDVGRHLAKKNVGLLTFVNRTDRHAQDLARECGGDWSLWTERSHALASADVIIAATSAPRPIISRADIEAAQRDRPPTRSLLVVDAGVPRNVEPGAPVELIDIDAIREQQDGVLARRQAEVPVVERIVSESVAAWEAWAAAMPIERALGRLFRDADELARRLAGALSIRSADADSDIEHLVRRELKQLLAPHARRLRALHQDAAGIPVLPIGPPDSVAAKSSACELS